MFQQSEIFEKNYTDYCSRIAGTNFSSITDILGITQNDDQLLIRFFNKEYLVSGAGITDKSGNRPDYGVCVILSKYILLCPDRLYHDTQWVSFKDFKKTSHFTNVNFFVSDTEQVILKQFSGKLDSLLEACDNMGGHRQELDVPYDLSVRFDALPRLSLLLLFNDSDEEFPAQGTVLFQKHAEFYLDPESLIMTSAALAKRLVVTSRQGEWT